MKHRIEIRGRNKGWSKLSVSWVRWGPDPPTRKSKQETPTESESKSRTRNGGRRQGMARFNCDESGKNRMRETKEWRDKLDANGRRERGGRERREGGRDSNRWYHEYAMEDLGSRKFKIFRGLEEGKRVIEAGILYNR
eukprot:760403-Hanusia_phi.AAC.6